MNPVIITMSKEKYDQIMIALQAANLYCKDHDANLIARELENAYYSMTVHMERELTQCERDAINPPVPPFVK